MEPELCTTAWASHWLELPPKGNVTLVRQLPAEYNCKWGAKLWAFSSHIPKTGTWVHSPEEMIGAHDNSTYYKWSFLIVRNSNDFYLSCAIKNWSLYLNKKILKCQVIWSSSLNFLSFPKQQVKENQSLAQLFSPDIICIELQFDRIAFFFFPHKDKDDTLWNIKVRLWHGLVFLMTKY